MIARLRLWVTAVGVVVIALVASWFGGRKEGVAITKRKLAERNLDVALQAEDIENEVEALDIDTLKSRSKQWVRNNAR